MDYLTNRKKGKKIKYKLKTSPSDNNEEKTDNKNEINNLENNKEAINSSIKFNGSLNPNFQITFGEGGGNIFANQSIKFNQNQNPNMIISKFTFRENMGNVLKNNLSIKQINEKVNENNEESDEDEEKYDIKVTDENDINYEDMLKKNDDEIRFLDFDNFLDASNNKAKNKKNNNNKNDIDDLCNIRYDEDEKKKIMKL